MLNNNNHKEKQRKHFYPVKIIPTLASGLCVEDYKMLRISIPL
jgi:hypothetical protein